MIFFFTKSSSDPVPVQKTRNQFVQGPKLKKNRKPNFRNKSNWICDTKQNQIEKQLFFSHVFYKAFSHKNRKKNRRCEKGIGFALENKKRKEKCHNPTSVHPPP